MERLWNKVVIKVERERGGVKGGGKGGFPKYLNKMNRRKEQPGLDRNYKKSWMGRGFMSIALLIRSQSYPSERIEYIGQAVGKINSHIPDAPINYCNYDGN